MADRFLIAPYDQQSGLHAEVKPFLIPDNAFSELNNAYVFRGRVRKRFGSRYMGGLNLTSRLRVQIGTTDGAGAFAGTVPNVAGVPTVTPAIGQIFSAGAEIYTVYTLAGAPLQLLRSTAGPIPSFDVLTSIFALVAGPINSPVYYYPALPVMGLLTADIPAVNDELLIGFDTKFAYQYINGWVRLANETTPNASIWNGTDTDFYWGTTWFNPNGSDKVFFVTNNNHNEHNYMRWLNLDPASLLWDNFNPRISNIPAYLISARLLIVFHNRLVALNTWEGPDILGALNYCNRARYNLATSSPLDPDSYNTTLNTKANAIDAGTSEAIITAEFVKDRLIVYFERSTWELAYTANEEAPFTWLQINTELGAESTHSIVPFDKVCIGVGQNGIHACNGGNTSRIDDKIPDEVFKIHNANDGPSRVYGVRDYYTEMIYWTFPDDIANPPTPYPVRVLTYNYKNDTWAFNADSITCFGYYQPDTTDETGVTWDSTEVTWDSDMTWGNAANLSQNRFVIAGNQEGFTFMIDRDEPTNAPLIQITNLAVAANVVTITSINHNFRVDDYIYFKGIVGSGNINLINDQIFKITTPPTTNTFQFTYFDGLGTILAGVYAGAGVMARVSNISIKTKEFNFYAKQLKNAYISKVDFYVEKTSVGAIQVNFYDSSSLQDMTKESIANNVILGTATLDTFGYNAAASPIPLEELAERVWHPVYFQAEGNVVQFHLTMNDTQMRNIAIRKCGFQLYAMAISAQSTTNRIW
jgi:hypothetical protein